MKPWERNYDTKPAQAPASGNTFTAPPPRAGEMDFLSTIAGQQGAMPAPLPPTPKPWERQYASPASKPASQTQEQGFFDRVGDDLQKRWQGQEDAAKAYLNDDQGLAQYLLQSGGTLAGSANDIIGEGLVSGFRALPDAAQKAIKDKAGQIGTEIANSPAGELGKKGIEAYQDFAKENPNADRSLRATGNIVMAAPMIKPFAAATEGAGTAIVRTGEALTQHGTKRALLNQRSFITDLVRPKDIPTVRAEQFGRAQEKGLLRTREVPPSPQEVEMIEAVSGLPVGKDKSLLANHNIIAEANKQEASSLIAALKRNDVAIPDDQVAQRLSGVRTNLSKNLYVAGDGEKAAESVVNAALEKILSQPRTASGLLQARKELDAWVKSQRGAGVFDPAREGAVTAAVRDVRQAINDMVAEAVPDVGVKQSLAKQSAYYRAMENIQTKGAFEAENALKRTAQRMADGVPGKTAAAKATLGAAGISAGILAPNIMLPAMAAYGGFKLATNPTSEQIIGRLLQNTGKAFGGKTDPTRQALIEALQKPSR